MKLSNFTDTTWAMFNNHSFESESITPITPMFFCLTASQTINTKTSLLCPSICLSIKLCFSVCLFVCLLEHLLLLVQITDICYCTPPYLNVLKNSQFSWRSRQTSMSRLHWFVWRLLLAVSSAWPLLSSLLLQQLPPHINSLKLDVCTALARGN